jgi:excinuclease UvrABC nuclease subunit
MIQCDSKVYIGKSIDIDSRIKQHIQQSQHQPKDNFHKTMAHNDWSWTVLELAPRRSLNKLEMKWIKHYNSFHCGWNLTIGGDNSYESSIRKEGYK